VIVAANEALTKAETHQRSVLPVINTTTSERIRECFNNAAKLELARVMAAN